MTHLKSQNDYPEIKQISDETKMTQLKNILNADRDSGVVSLVFDRKGRIEVFSSEEDSESISINLEDNKVVLAVETEASLLTEQPPLNIATGGDSRTRWWPWG